MSPTARRESRLSASQSGARPVNESRALEWLWQHLQDDRRPHILDCGPVRQATINVLLRRGAKLYAADLISPLLRGDPSFWRVSQKTTVFRPEVFLAHLPELPAASLSSVLCWHLLDLLPGAALPAVMGKLLACLRPGGVLFGLLREPYLPAGAEATWWLETLTTLGTGEEAKRPFAYPAVTNRETERLVAPCGVKTFLTRTGRREILVIK
jgi:hypothetical protein